MQCFSWVNGEPSSLEDTQGRRQPQGGAHRHSCRCECLVIHFWNISSLSRSAFVICCNERSTIRVQTGPLDRLAVPALRPPGAKLEQHQRPAEERGGAAKQTRGIRASRIAHRTKHKGQEESSQPA